jgi:hypothetical protein
MPLTVFGHETSRQFLFSLYKVKRGAADFGKQRQ